MHDHPLAGQVLGGAYRVVGPGEAPGSALEAVAVATGARVSLEPLPSSSGSDPLTAQRRIRSGLRARHPNLLEVDVLRHDAALYLVIEPRVGESLRALLGRRGARGVVLLRHLLGAMRGAAALHKLGVIHGDIRPENIFLDLDAREREPTPMLLHRPGVRAPRSDRAYRAPEQRAGWLLDARTDVYGFGVVLHEVLTGRLPADVHAAPRAGAAGRCGGVLGPDSEHVPPGLGRLVRAALQPDPALRPNSVEALMAAIEPYTRCAALRSPLPPRPRLAEAAPPHRPARAWLGMVLVALAVLGVLGAAALQPDLAARARAALASGALPDHVRSSIVAAAGVLPGFASAARQAPPAEPSAALATPASIDE